MTTHPWLIAGAWIYCVGGLLFYHVSWNSNRSPWLVGSMAVFWPIWLLVYFFVWLGDG